jgi:hypothetical protein
VECCAHRVYAPLARRNFLTWPYFGQFRVLKISGFPMNKSLDQFSNHPSWYMGEEHLNGIASKSKRTQDDGGCSAAASFVHRFAPFGGPLLYGDRLWIPAETLLRCSTLPRSRPPSRAFKCHPKMRVVDWYLSFQIVSCLICVSSPGDGDGIG